MKLEILLLVVGLLCSVDAFNVPGGPKCKPVMTGTEYKIKQPFTALFALRSG